MDVLIMKVLILSPHPDDMEYNMGGTAVKMKTNGVNVAQIVFSDCIKLKGNSFILGSKASAERLGINTSFHKFPNQEFMPYRSQIRELLHDQLGFKYDIVFVPCRQDWHQDHQVVTQEAIRIFRKNTTILGYIKDEIFERHHDLKVWIDNYAVNERVELMRLFNMEVPPINTEWFEVIQLRNYL